MPITPSPSSPLQNQHVRKMSTLVSWFPRPQLEKQGPDDTHCCYKIGDLKISRNHKRRFLCIRDQTWIFLFIPLIGYKNGNKPQ